MDLWRPFLLVTTTLDGDVLQALAMSRDEVTVGQIQRAIGRGSLPGLRKVLVRLVGQGLVESERVANTVVFSLREEHLAAPLIRGLASLPNQIIHLTEQTLAAWEVQPLFGCILHNRARWAQAITLLLISPDLATTDLSAIGARELWLRQCKELARDLSDWTGSTIIIDDKDLPGLLQQIKEVKQNGQQMSGAVAGGDVVCGSRDFIDLVRMGRITPG